MSWGVETKDEPFTPTTATASVGETLGEACAQTGWRVHAYVLMDNHYHLLLQTPEANLVAGMKWLQSTEGFDKKGGPTFVLV